MQILGKELETGNIISYGSTHPIIQVSKPTLEDKFWNWRTEDSPKENPS